MITMNPGNKILIKTGVIVLVTAVVFFEATPLNAQILGNTSSIRGFRLMQGRISIGSSAVSNFRRFSTGQNTLNASIRP